MIEVLEREREGDRILKGTNIPSLNLFQGGPLPYRLAEFQSNATNVYGRKRGLIRNDNDYIK